MRLGDSALIEFVHHPNFKIADDMAMEAILGSLWVVCTIG
jgi:hypothetical protein